MDYKDTGALTTDDNLQATMIDDGSSPVRPQVMVSDEAPPKLMQMTNRFANVLLNASFVALVRTTVLERQRVAEATPAPPGGQVPEWFADTWKAKNMGRQFTSTFLKETGIFVAATFCMEGVEAALNYVRGRKDPFHRVMGGVAAGGLLSLAWYPNNYRARSIMTATGAAVGFVSHALESSGERYLLMQQQALEKEVLHKAPQELRTELNPYYLRSLLRAHQHLQAMKAQQAAKDNTYPSPVNGNASSTSGNSSDSSLSARMAPTRSFGVDGWDTNTSNSDPADGKLPGDASSSEGGGYASNVAKAYSRKTSASQQGFPARDPSSSDISADVLGGNQTMQAESVTESMNIDTDSYGTVSTLNFGTPDSEPGQMAGRGASGTGAEPRAGGQGSWFGSGGGRDKGSGGGRSGMSGGVSGGKTSAEAGGSGGVNALGGSSTLVIGEEGAQ